MKNRFLSTLVITVFIVVAFVPLIVIQAQTDSESITYEGHDDHYSPENDFVSPQDVLRNVLSRYDDAIAVLNSHSELYRRELIKPEKISGRVRKRIIVGSADSSFRSDLVAPTFDVDPTDALTLEPTLTSVPTNIPRPTGILTLESTLTPVPTDTPQPTDIPRTSTPEPTNTTVPTVEPTVPLIETEEGEIPTPSTTVTPESSGGIRGVLPAIVRFIASLEPFLAACAIILSASVWIVTKVRKRRNPEE